MCLPSSRAVRMVHLRRVGGLRSSTGVVVEQTDVWEAAMSGSVRRILVAATCASVAFVFTLHTVDAAIVSGSGNVQHVAPPASVISGATEHATDVFAFDEQQGVTLASALRTDIQSPGVYDEIADLQATTVATGTVIDSHLVHSDRTATGTTLRDFTITFRTDILGVIVTQGKLTDSDVLGAPGTTYGGANRNLGFGAGAQADIVILPDQRTIHGIWQTTTGVDHMRVITAHNSPPVANAGGPYAGVEGTAVPLAATATDPEGNALTIAWTVTHTSDPGTICTVAAGSTLTPTVTCNDDAMVAATMSVSDGTNPAVTSVAQIAIGNVAPTPGAVGAPTEPVALGASAPISLPFTDDGANDTHSATVAWGDTTSSAGSVSESGGTGSVAATHTYSSPGLYTVTVTVTDDDTGTASTTAQIAVNGPPTADAGGPYSGSEGIPTALSGTSVDPENDPLTVNWTFTPTAIDAGATCAATSSDTLAPSLTCDDDAVVTADLTATDGINPPVLSSTTVAVANEAPLLGSLVAPAGPLATGAPVTVSAPFTDDGANDTHTATVSWGDLTSSAATVTESAGSGSLSASHSYGTPGIYTITITLNDDDAGSDVRTATVVVNSPPTADAGGPYAGLEGSALALSGTADDADGDSLSVSWSFSVTGDAGVVCTTAGTGTLTPTVSCTDDAVVTATLTVSDGVNAPVVTAAEIVVGNVAPVSDGAVPSTDVAPTGSTVSVSMAFADDGTNDGASAIIDWGDGTSETGSVISASGSGTVSGSHVYATSGTFTITVTVTDDNGAPIVATTSVSINGVPTAGAGGPYAGVEGAPVALTGVAADPDIDDLDVTWTSTIVSADAGTACSLTGATTLTPELTCDDDALVSVTLSVSDGINPTVVDTVTVDVANADPSLSAVTALPNPVPLGQSTAILASFTDPGVNDTHVATVEWGDATTSPAAVTEVPGSVSGSHTYAAAGTYTVKVTLNDKDGGKSTATVLVVVNAPPTIDAAGPYSGTEGMPLALAGTATDPDGDPIALSWSFGVSTDPGGSCAMAGTATLVPTITCTDDAAIEATLTADDGVNPPVIDTATIAIANQAPGIGLVSVPTAPVPIGTAVSAVTTFVDAGSNDTHIATVAWGDTTSSSGTVTETAGNGSVAASHTYSAAGTYEVSITVIDDDTGEVTGTSSARVVVFDAGNGFVTGGGWINSPSGAYTPNNPNDPNLVGKATFGFVARKRPTDSVPTGNTEFQLQLRKSGHDNEEDDDDDRHRRRDDRRDDGWSRTASFNFKSTAYTTLTVSNSNTKAIYRGTGKVNGVSGYEFLVSVIDGRSTHSADKFRIKIWKTSTGEVLYDNMAGAADDANATQTVSCGSIVIHS